LQTLGYGERWLLVGKSVGFLDELSTLGDNTIAEFYHDRAFATSVMSPRIFRCSLLFV